jgi:hypothetical protein
MNEETEPNGENGGDSQGNPVQDVANRYFSVEVAPLPSSTEGTDTAAYTYFRMGMPDEATEGKLPPHPQEPETEGDADKSPWKDGLLLYTTGEYQLVTPSSSEAAAESLEVIADGSSLYSVKYNTAEAWPWAANAVLGATETTVKRLNELTASLGTAINAIIGIEQTFWNGSYTHYGVGAATDVILGRKISVEAAEEINFGLGWTGLHGGGTSNATKEFDVFSAGPIRLSSSPTNDMTLAGWEAWRSTLAKALIVAAAATPTVIALGTTIPSFAVWGANENKEDLKKNLLAAHIELGALMGVFTVIQVGIVLAAAITRTTQHPAAVAADLVNPSAAILKLDQATNVANRAYLMVGQRQIVFDEASKILLKNGTLPPPAPTPTIRISPTSIQLSVGQSQISIDGNGVTISGTTNITCAGGGASLNLATAGATLAGPQIQLNAVDPATQASTNVLRTVAQAEAAAALGTAQAAIAAEVTKRAASEAEIIAYIDSVADLAMEII